MLKQVCNCLLVSLVALFALTGNNVAQEPAQGQAGEQSLQKFIVSQPEQDRDKIKAVESQAGFIKFLSMPAQTKQTKKATTAQAKENALNFLAENKHLFVSKTDRVDFRDIKVKTKNYENLGIQRTFVRCKQTYSGLDVYCAQTIVQVGQSGGIETVISDIMQDTSELDNNPGALTPVIGLADAQAAAINIAQNKYQGWELKTKESQLLIFAPAVLGKEGNPELAWKIVIGTDDINIEKVLVSAISGGVIHNASLISYARYREVYNYNNSVLLRDEGDPPCGVSDADKAYDYMGSTYNFYSSYHGRDSYDNNGSHLIAYIYCPWGPTWMGSYMNIPTGRVADDIVGHEITHGVNDNEVCFEQNAESEAISEFLCDMWGEWIDQTNGLGTDTPAVKWLLGEDDSVTGVLRSMKNPPAYSPYGYPMPDRYYHPNYNSSTDPHHKGGVGDKLSYLLTDGDSFNGYTISGMGIDTVSDLMYECLCNLLTPTVDYKGFATALMFATENLGFNATQRNNVRNACYAVEIMTEVYNQTKGIEYTSIQAAINGASNGDIIIVYPGVYLENLTLGSKAITIRSSNPDSWAVVEKTIIDGSCSNTRTVNIAGNATLSGFTIQGGYSAATSAPIYGGGILCYPGSATISKCIIKDNYTGFGGGGICIYNASPTITNCKIYNNSVTNYGGGIRVEGTSYPVIRNSLIYNNTSANQGGAFYRFYNASSSLTVTNCTITNNTATTGDGIKTNNGSGITVKNTIIWGDSISYSSTAPTVTYSCIQGGFTGTGNISSNPNMNSTYHLVYPSPCINAGATGDYTGQTDIDGANRVNLGQIDMGADEY